MRNSVGGIGLPTEPTRRSASPGGIEQNAGPASVIPHELATIACGNRWWRRRRVSGATGELPRLSIPMLDSSAVSNRGLAMSSWAMAGTRNTALGWRCSTTSNQRAASKRGR